MLYIGSVFMQEFERTLEDKTRSYQRISNYLSLTLKNTQNTIELNSIMYYQPNVTYWKDYRLSSQTSLAVNITSKLQFTTNLNYGFDAYAPINVSKRNILISNGLKLNL